MKIFLDTNVFYNDWFMQNANFKYLFNYLNNEGHSLLLSNLVVEESENIRNRELAGALSEITKNIKKAQKLNANKLNYDQGGLGIENYELRPLLSNRTEEIEIISYDDIRHSEVVNRALKTRKPFLEGEKGYRDTLMWLSFLDYLVINDIDDDVAFITQNKSDFFKVEDKVVGFHPDLISDIRDRGVKAKLIPFTSLFELIKSTVDKDEHAIDQSGSEEIFSDYIESSAIDYLESMSNSNLSEYLEDSIFDTKVKNIISIRTDVLEGLEDTTVQRTSRLENDDVYVSYSYNLRRVFLFIDIPEMDYNLNKEELDRIFYDVEISNDVATLNCLVRPYFDVSFIYNDREETLKDYEVDDLWLRR